MTPAAPTDATGPLPAPRPASESERLAALRRYRILDTGSEVDFEDVAAMAARLADMPVALVSLVDEGRAWFKARIGLDVPEAPRDLAFCSWAVHDPSRPLQVDDLTEDERFAANPLVTAEGGFRAYTGVPLVTADGHALGTLCVLDHQTRSLDEEQVDGLQRLARTVMSHLEARRVAQALLSVTQVLDEVRSFGHLPDVPALARAAEHLLLRLTEADGAALVPASDLPAWLGVDGAVRLLDVEGAALSEEDLSEDLRERGAVAALHVPLVRDGALHGCLTAWWRTPVVGGEATLQRLLEVLAHETTSALLALQDRQVLRTAADTDALTGLHNRRAAAAQLESWPRCTVALVDLDHFKAVNDRLGHDAGDAVLQQFAAELARRSRPGDLVCRWGGEEFLVALRRPAAPVLEEVLDRVRDGLAGSGSEVRFSAGLSVRRSGETVRELLQRADRALYRAKAAGRGRTLHG